MKEALILLRNFFLAVPDSGFLFTGFGFWIFLCLALGVYSALYRKSQARNGWLLAASLFFYYKAGGFLVLALLVSVWVNYHIGRRMMRKSAAIWMWLGIVFNVVLLAAFKYSPWKIPTLGLSFFTLLGIGYLVDLKRGTAAPSPTLLDFALYMSFFPKLIAGPVTRWGEFAPQLHKTYMLGSGEFSKALGLILLGLVKKMVVADYLAFHFVNPVLENPHLYTSFETWMAVYGYAVRIYCDFSGYTDIAIGVAALFDIHLPVNFRSPYKASSLTDFWHRWHISLSTWFRDYLYIPLGGNRRGLLAMLCAVVLTMAVAGLWHGVGVCFVIWGCAHGLLLALEKLIGWHKWINRRRWSQIVGWVVCFHLVCFGWVFFQAPSLEAALGVFERMALPTEWGAIGSILLYYRWIFALMAAVMVIMLFVKERRKENLSRLFYRAPLWLKFLISLLIVVLILFTRNLAPQDFIYFQF